MPRPSACQMGSDDDDNVKQIGKVLVQTARLIHLGAIVAFGGTGNPQLLWQMVVVEPGSVLEPGAMRLLFLGGAQIEFGVVLHLGNDVQTHLPYHRGGESIAKVAVENKVGDLEFVSDQVHHLLSLRQDALQFRREREIGFILVLAALGTTACSLGSALLALVFTLSGLLLFFFGAHHLLDREGMGASLCDVNEGNREERQAGNDGI